MKESRSLSEKDVIEMLEVSKANHEKIYAWYALGNHVLWTEVSILNIVKNKRELVFTATESSVIFLDEIISGKGKVNMYLESGKLVFTSSLKEYTEEGKLILHYPDHFFVEDRREGGRTYLESAVKIELNHKKKVIKRDCYDFGDGGLSFVLSNTETLSFTLKDKVKLAVNIEGTVLNLEAEVVAVTKLKPFKFENTPYGGKKISLKYLGQTKEQESSLKNFLKKFKTLSKE